MVAAAGRADAGCRGPAAVRTSYCHPLRASAIPHLHGPKRGQAQQEGALEPTTRSRRADGGHDRRSDPPAARRPSCSAVLAFAARLPPEPADGSRRRRDRHRSSRAAAAIWPSAALALVAHGRAAGGEAGRAAGALRGGPRRCADGPADRVGQSPRLPRGARSAGRGGPPLQRPALAPSRSTSTNSSRSTTAAAMPTGTVSCADSARCSNGALRLPIAPSASAATSSRCSSRTPISMAPASSRGAC